MTGLLHRVLAPSSAVVDRADQSRVRLLQGFLLCAATVATTRGIAQSLITPGASSTAMVLLAGGLLFGAYLTARSPYWRAAAAVAILVPTVVPVGIGLRNPLDPTWYAISLVGTLLAATFFSLRLAAATATFTLFGVISVILVSPVLHTPERAIPIVALVVVTSGLYLFIARHRDQLAAMHAAELQAQERKKAQDLRLESVGRLATGVAHDVNNLLTVVLCNTELVLMATDDDHVQSLATEILEASERGTSLVSDLLAFTTRQRRAVSHFDLGDAVARFLPVLRRLVGDGVELHFERTEGRLPVAADRGHLFRVVLNLVVNARDATQSGGRITLSVGGDAAEEPQGGWLSVADTGAGIPPEVQERIFEPFFTTKASGNGLGLAIIHDSIRGMGGRIDLATGAGGTTFTVHLPLTEAPPEAPTEPASAESGVKLMLVDDDDLVRRAASRALEASGYAVVEASGGEAALQALQSHADIALLITDVRMEGMSGHELVRHVAGVAPQLPTLLISADDAQPRDDAAPGASFLAKPFTHDELRAAVEAVLHEASERPAS